ncbi:MAG: hypothetical protein EOP13_08795 [Pseudomonas sp.]|jgi:membrane protein implicated in regulation of membrane protease activity|uniref:hypothetical protein n=1 Tax=Pseudomonas sp. TaxID=306 RepID=UPI00121758C9|nr:hypothetical protein [Pseudomonas sp.]RZI74387.1 MAG: hypothetical protein EOP13_08795 [Pseudomonas sp.]
MHIVVIAWLYVALMMAVAEGTNTTGTVVGAVFTFLLYGVAPVALVVYLMGAPARRKRIRRMEQEQQDSARAIARPGTTDSAVQPDAGGESSTDSVAPMRKET